MSEINLVLIACGMIFVVLLASVFTHLRYEKVSKAARVMIAGFVMFLAAGVYFYAGVFGLVAVGIIALFTVGVQLTALKR